MSEATIVIEPGFQLSLQETTHIEVMKRVASLLQMKSDATRLRVEVDGLLQVDGSLDFELIWPKPAFVSRTLDKYRKHTSARITHSERIQPVIDEWMEIGKLMVAVMDEGRQQLAHTGVIACLRAIPQLGLDNESRELAYHTVALVAWMACQKDFAVTDSRTRSINLFISLLSELIRP